MILQKTLIRTFVLLALFHASGAWSRENRWTHFGLRPLGMGNAWVAVSDDYNALFYNPAGLARLKSWDGEFINPALEISQKTLSILREVQGAEGSLFTDTSDALTFLKDHAGETHHAGLYLTPHLVMPGFGVGFGLDAGLELVTHNTVNIDVDGGARIILPVAFAKNFLEDRLSVGASVKLLMSMGIEHSFTLQDLTLLSTENGLDNLLHSGNGVGFDAGFLFTPIEPMQPTLGVSVTDIGGTTFRATDTIGNGSKAPAPRKPSVNMGISLKPVQKGPMYLLTAVDTHMINQPVHFTHKLNLGLEFGYSEIIKLQAGLKEGYATAGLQFDVGLLNLRLATYAVDHAPLVGSHDKLVERRFAFQLKLLI